MAKIKVACFFLGHGVDKETCVFILLLHAELHSTTCYLIE